MSVTLSRMLLRNHAWIGTSLAMFGSGVPTAVEGDARISAPVCVLQACQLLGIPVDLDNLRDAPEVSSASHLAQIATDLGCAATVRHLSVDELLRSKAPVIAQIGERDFVTIGAMDSVGRTLFILNPPNAPYWATAKDFVRTWSGDVLLMQAAPQILGPRLWADSSTPSVGKLGRIAGQRRQFTVLNIGNEPLELIVAKASCSCTSVQVPETIPPRGFGIVDLVIDGSQKNPGPFSANLRLVTNDREKPVHNFRLTGQIGAAFAFYPTVFNLGDMPPNTRPRTLLTAGRFAEGMRGRLAIADTSPGLTVDSLESSADGGYEIRLLVEPSELVRTEDGVVLGIARFATGLAEAPYLEISVDGRLLPVLSAMPAAVFLRATKGGAPHYRTVDITSYAEGEFKVDVSDDTIITVLYCDQKGVELLVTTPAKAGIFKASVWITHGDYRLEVPVVGLVADD